MTRHTELPVGWERKPSWIQEPQDDTRIVLYAAIGPNWENKHIPPIVSTSWEDVIEQAWEYERTGTCLSHKQLASIRDQREILP